MAGHGATVPKPQNANGRDHAPCDAHEGGNQVELRVLLFVKSDGPSNGVRTQGVTVNDDVLFSSRPFVPHTPFGNPIARASASLKPEQLAPIRRVALFAEAFLPKLDGVSKTALFVLQHLQETGRDVIVFAPDNAPPFVGPSQVIRVPSFGVPVYPESRVATPSPMVMSIVRDFKPDLIHLFSPISVSIAGMLAGRTMRIPVVANYQTDLPGYASQYGMDFMEWPLRELLRLIHVNSHLTLAPSTATLRQLHEWGFPRLRLWGRGADCDMFNPAKRSEEWRKRLLAGRDPDRLLCLYVGRLAHEKHLECLHGVAKLPGVALTIVGDGALRREIEELYSDTDTVFTGYLIGEDLARAYASADIFAFPGTNETFGQVVLEALASGLPVVAAAAGGVTDMVIEGETGILCEPRNEEDFTRAVALLRDDPELRRRLAEGARRFAEGRPWSVIMAQLEDYYKEAIEINEYLLEHGTWPPDEEFSR